MSAESTTHADTGVCARNASDWRARVRRAYLQIFGIPDYPRYLEHMARHHPGVAVMTERAFHAHAIDRKYCRNGPRCC